MKRLCTAAGAALLALAVTPARAEGERVALVPAQVVKGDPANGRTITAALRAYLQKQGYEVLPARDTEAAIRKDGLDLGRQQFSPALSKLRETAGVDLVAYPRVLGVGTGVNSDEYQATIIVNLQGENPKNPVWTRQIAQVFKQPKPVAREKAVISRADADTAAAKLFEGFRTAGKEK